MSIEIADEGFVGNERGREGDIEIGCQIRMVGIDARIQDGNTDPRSGVPGVPGSGRVDGEHVPLIVRKERLIRTDVVGRELHPFDVRQPIRPHIRNDHVKPL